MPSFSIPLTGLESDNTALNVIANNLANMSTTGFKAQSTNFSDLFYQQIGSNGAGDPLEVGTGVGVASTATDFSSGPISATAGISTNMALDGNGFFVTDVANTTQLTRAGDFNISDTGQLVTAGGATVMGYPATNGVVNTSAALTPMTLPIGQTQQPQATTALSFTGNLDATAAVGTVTPATISIYDSLGTAHTVTITMTKTAANTWGYSVALPAGEAAATTGTTGTFVFDGSGNLNATASTVPHITMTGLADGASNLALTLNTQGAGGTSLITQDAGASSVTDTTQNGYQSGVYNSFSVGSDGTVSASFSNGESTTVGKIAIANVANQQGLNGVGADAYMTTLASGTASYGVAGSGSNGSIEGASLEGSNVDISAEFSDLIVAQRAFEANSKSITTFDSVTQETINMIH